MLFSTHVKMGNVLHEWLKTTHACRLPRQAFLYGNIKPDLERSGKTDRHVLSNSDGWMSALMAGMVQAAENPGPDKDPVWAAIALGELCHHITDAFCRYHYDPVLYTDFRNHFLYEWGLHKRFCRRMEKGLLPTGGKPPMMSGVHPVQKEGVHGEEAQTVPAASILGHLYMALQEYGACTASFDLDIQYAMQTCMTCLFLLVPAVKRVLQGRAEMNSLLVPQSGLPAYVMLFPQDAGLPVYPDASLLVDMTMGTGMDVAMEEVRSWCTEPDAHASAPWMGNEDGKYAGWGSAV